jgi:hypothetical protein
MKTNIISKSKYLILVHINTYTGNRGKAAHLLTAGTKKRKRPEYLQKEAFILPHELKSIKPRTSYQLRMTELEKNVFGRGAATFNNSSSANPPTMYVLLSLLSIGLHLVADR